MRVLVTNWRRFVVGLVCGPTIAIYLIPLGNCAVAPMSGASNCWAGITGFTWYGLPLIGAIVAVVLPLILLSLRSGRTGLVYFVVAGALVAMLAAAVLALLDSSLGVTALIIGFTPLGGIAAVVFWFIAIRRNVTTKSE